MCVIIIKHKAHQRVPGSRPDTSCVATRRWRKRKITRPHSVVKTKPGGINIDHLPDTLIQWSVHWHICVHNLYLTLSEWVLNVIMLWSEWEPWPGAVRASTHSKPLALTMHFSALAWLLISLFGLRMYKNAILIFAEEIFNCLKSITAISKPKHGIPCVFERWWGWKPCRGYVILAKVIVVNGFIGSF